MIQFELTFEGADAEVHELDFYEAAQALLGFQRSLALTTHLVLNGEVITQAPALKNARILVTPPDEGSWKVVAVVMTALVGGLYKAGTAPKDTPLGHLIYSAYDYVVCQSLGFHVDYDLTLGQQYERSIRSSEIEAPRVEESQLDSVIEKCDAAIREIHRPIIKSKTAKEAKLKFADHAERKSITFSKDTYEFMNFS